MKALPRSLAVLTVPAVALLGCQAGDTTRTPGVAAGGIGGDAQVAAVPVPVAVVNVHLTPAEAAARNLHADLESPIDSDNVGRMKLAWKFDTGENVSHTPIVEGGRVYFADWGGTAYAVDARTGELIWKRNVEKPRRAWPWHGFCGTGALADGVLYEASAEGTAFALDAKTGQVRWQKRFVDDREAGNCGRLLCHDGLLYIAVSSVEEPMTKQKEGFKPDFRGKVLALDVRNGAKVWERRLVDAPHNGVAVWSGFALDPELNLLYFTTGNNYTGEASPLSDAMIAADAKTGRIVWARQFTSHDVWTMAEPIGPDYDFAAAPQLFEANIGGQLRRLVGAGQKSGRFWALDRRTGQAVWNTTVGYGHVGGGMHAEASIGVGRIYLWGNNAYPYHGPAEHPMDVKCVDATSGRYLWSNPKAQPAALSSAGVLAGDVYFVGSLDTKVRGYRAADGRLVWTSQQTGPVASSLAVSGDSIYFGVGVPKHFGGGEGAMGLFAFSTGSAPSTPPQPASGGPPSADGTEPTDEDVLPSGDGGAQSTAANQPADAGPPAGASQPDDTARPADDPAAQ